MINSIAAKDNPFKQTVSTWLVKLVIEHRYIDSFESYFADIALSISYFEYEVSEYFETSPTDKWMLNIYLDHKPDISSVNNIVKSASTDNNIDIPNFTIEEIEDKDWVSEVQKNFKPFIIGNFYIHNSSHNFDKPADKYSIMLDAGRAFGTGEHETTSGCLEAISYLAIDNKFNNILDIGCGTAILAIAAAKIWQNKVLATDIDEVAVEVAKANILINNVEDYVNCYVCDGYNSTEIKVQSPFDLIISNILAKPLIEFAFDLSKNLAIGGYAILAGLLAYQEREVINAHTALDLKLINIIRKNSWSIIILKKS